MESKLALSARSEESHWQWSTVKLLEEKYLVMDEEKNLRQSVQH